MLRTLLSAYRTLFVSLRSRLGVAALVVLTACVPLLEMVAMHQFSAVVLGVGGVSARKIAGPALLMLAIFVLARGGHHALRLVRIRVFASAFEQTRGRSRSSQSWAWAQAFELSGILVALVQAAVLSLVFVLLDPIVGAAAVIGAVAVLGTTSLTFTRQLGHQRGFLADRAGAITVAERVRSRLRHSELAAIMASAVVVLLLAAVLARLSVGGLAPQNALVLFLGLRLLGGQLSSMAGGVMRFARATARLEVP